MRYHLLHTKSSILKILLILSNLPVYMKIDPTTRQFACFVVPAPGMGVSNVLPQTHADWRRRALNAFAFCCIGFFLCDLRS